MPPKKQSYDKILDKCTRPKYLQIANDITHTEDIFTRLLNNKNFIDVYDNSYYSKSINIGSYSNNANISNTQNTSIFCKNLIDYIKNNVNTISREFVLLLLNNQITQRHYTAVSEIGDILIPLLSKVSFTIDINFLNDVVSNTTLKNIINILNTYNLKPTEETLTLILKNNENLYIDYYYGNTKQTFYDKLMNDYNIPITYDHLLLSCKLNNYYYTIIKHKLNQNPDAKCLEIACLYKNEAIIDDILSYNVIPTKECLYNYTLYNNDLVKYKNHCNHNTLNKLLAHVPMTIDCVLNILNNNRYDNLVDKAMQYADNSYEVLIRLCKLNNTSKYILKIIESGTIPDNNCLKEICKTKQNVKALTKILEYVEPTKEDIITAYRKK